MEGQRLGHTSSLGMYESVSNQASSGAAKQCTNPEIPPAKSRASFASHHSKLTPFAQAVQKHHWHQQPGWNLSGGAGGWLTCAGTTTTAGKHPEKLPFNSTPGTAQGLQHFSWSELALPVSTLLVSSYLNVMWATLWNCMSCLSSQDVHQEMGENLFFWPWLKLLSPQTGLTHLRLVNSPFLGHQTQKFWDLHRGITDRLYHYAKSSARLLGFSPSITVSAVSRNKQ